jgi:hypothetical protein
MHPGALELIEMPARRATIESPYAAWHQQRGAASLALMEPADGHADGARFTLWLRRCPPKGIPHELITFGVGRAVPRAYGTRRGKNEPHKLHPLGTVNWQGIIRGHRTRMK